MIQRLERLPFPGPAPELLDAWGRLLAEATEPSVFSSAEWLGAWWNAYGAGLEPLLLASRERDGSLSGLAPLYAWRRSFAGLPGPRVVSFMGDRAVGSDYLGVLVRRGHEERFLASLAATLEGEWSLLELNGLREEGRLSTLLPRVLGAAGGRRYEERDVCSAIALPGDYDSYLATLSPKFRASLRQRTQRLSKDFDVRLVMTTRQDELEARLSRLFYMHEARWTSEGLSGCFADPRMRAFYREMSAAFLRRGWLRFYHLEVDGEVRASQFGFVFGGVFHSLQEAFDHTFESRGAGGFGVVLRARVLRACIDEGVRIYDFLGGDEEFKQRWGTRPHYVRALRIAAPGAAGALAFTATAGVRKAKDWGRANLPRGLFAARARWREWRRRLRAESRSGRCDREAARRAQRAP